MYKQGTGTHYDHNTGKEEPTYCPVNGWDCPYYRKGVCFIENPLEDCLDWQNMWDSWEEWEDA